MPGKYKLSQQENKREECEEIKGIDKNTKEIAMLDGEIEEAAKEIAALTSEIDALPAKIARWLDECQDGAFFGGAFFINPHKALAQKAEKRQTAERELQKIRNKISGNDGEEKESKKSHMGLSEAEREKFMALRKDELQSLLKQQEKRKVDLALLEEEYNPSTTKYGTCRLR